MDLASNNIIIDKSQTPSTTVPPKAATPLDQDIHAYGVTSMIKS